MKNRIESWEEGYRWQFQVAPTEAKETVILRFCEKIHIFLYHYIGEVFMLLKLYKFINRKR